MRRATAFCSFLVGDAWVLSKAQQKLQSSRTGKLISAIRERASSKSTWTQRSLSVFAEMWWSKLKTADLSHLTVNGGCIDLWRNRWLPWTPPCNSRSWEPPSWGGCWSSGCSWDGNKSDCFRYSDEMVCRLFLDVPWDSNERYYDASCWSWSLAGSWGSFPGKRSAPDTGFGCQRGISRIAEYAPWHPLTLKLGSSFFNSQHRSL